MMVGGQGGDGGQAGLTCIGEPHLIQWLSSQSAHRAKRIWPQNLTHKSSQWSRTRMDCGFSGQRPDEVMGMHWRSILLETV